jgi:hypothetical protein
MRKMNNPPKGRDIMAVYHFYSGEMVEQKYEGSCTKFDGLHVMRDGSIPDLESKFLHLDNGVIRQTKDIEKVVWSYC